MPNFDLNAMPNLVQKISDNKAKPLTFIPILSKENKVMVNLLNDLDSNLDILPVLQTDTSLDDLKSTPIKTVPIDGFKNLDTVKDQLKAVATATTATSAVETTTAAAVATPKNTVLVLSNDVKRDELEDIIKKLPTGQS